MPCCTALSSPEKESTQPDCRQKDTGGRTGESGVGCLPSNVQAKRSGMNRQLTGAVTEWTRLCQAFSQFLKLSQNSLFKADTYVRSVAESGFWGLVLVNSYGSSTMVSLRVDRSSCRSSWCGSLRSLPIFRLLSSIAV